MLVLQSCDWNRRLLLAEDCLWCDIFQCLLWRIQILTRIASLYWIWFKLHLTKIYPFLPLSFDPFGRMVPVHQSGIIIMSLLTENQLNDIVDMIVGDYGSRLPGKPVIRYFVSIGIKNSAAITSKFLRIRFYLTAAPHLPDPPHRHGFTKRTWYDQTRRYAALAG